MPPPSTALHLLLPAFLLLHHTAALLPSCYAPDGSLSPGDGYLPCINTLDIASMCCVLNVTALHEVGETIANMDTCLPSGLCETSSGQFLRNYCTDKTWQSPNCLNICTGGSDGGAHNSNTFMTQCSNGSWCCGQGNLTSCCDVGQGFQVAAAIPPFTASGDSSSTAVVSAVPATLTAVVTSPAVASTQPSPNSSGNGLSVGISIGLGVALGFVIVGAAVAVFVMRRRLRKAREREAHAAAGGSEVFGRGKNSELEQLHVVHEVGLNEPPVEMDGGAVEPKVTRASWRWH